MNIDKGFFNTSINTDKIVRKLAKKWIPKFFEESMFLFSINFLFILIYLKFNEIKLFINGINIDLINILQNFPLIILFSLFFFISTVLFFYPIYISTKLVFSNRLMTESEKPPLIWGGIISFAFVGLISAIYSFLRIDIFESIQIKDVIIILLSFVTCFQSIVMLNGIKFVNIEQKLANADSKRGILIVEFFIMMMVILLCRYFFNFDATSNLLSTFIITNSVVQFLHQPYYKIK